MRYQVIEKFLASLCVVILAAIPMMTVYKAQAANQNPLSHSSSDYVVLMPNLTLAS